MNLLSSKAEYEKLAKSLPNSLFYWWVCFGVIYWSGSFTAVCDQLAWGKGTRLLWLCVISRLLHEYIFKLTICLVSNKNKQKGNSRVSFNGTTHILNFAAQQMHFPSLEKPDFPTAHDLFTRTHLYNKEMINQTHISLHFEL